MKPHIGSAEYLFCKDWRLWGGAVAQQVEQDTEPWIAPEGPAMSWRLVEGVPCLRPETAGIGSSNKPSDPLKKG